MFDFFFEPVSIKRCGCYAVSPLLVGVQQQQNILVPLRSCNYHLEIVNAMVNVTLVQTYQNPTNKFLEVQYSFPVAHNACIYRFVAEFGGHRMEGVVKEIQFARMEYQEAVKEGKKAAYGEKNTKEDDMLTLKIGNIGPKQQVTIEIQYLHELSLSFNIFYELKVPVSVAPRFLNILPKNVISQGYRSYGVLKMAEEVFTWSFQITLRTTRKVTFFSSSSHNLQVVKQNDTHTESIITMSETSPNTKEFVLSYTTEDYQLPSCVFGRSDKSSTAMLSFIPKFCKLSLGDAYKASIQGKTLQGEIDLSKGEYIFLLDRSGSMKGKKIEKAKEALVLFIKSLPTDSYFNVVSFGSNSKRLFNQSRPYKNHFIQDAVGQVQEMTANYGGTDIYHPLSQLLQDKKKEGYPKHLFLLTDGEVSDTQSIFRMIGRNNKYSRVHCIGVGYGASEMLIKGCAKNGKGVQVFIGDNEDPSEKIIQLLADSLSPMIDSINLEFDENIVESIIPNPKSLPYFLKGQIVNFYVTFKGQLSLKAHFSFSYKDSNQLPYSAEITVDPELPSQPFIDRMGHFRNIKVLEESFVNGGDIEENMYFVKKIDKKAEIISQSVRHQILSDFTAFVSVQKKIIDGKSQQINDTGKAKIIIINPQIAIPPPQLDQLIFKCENNIGSCRIPSLKQLTRNSRSNMIGCYRAMDREIGSVINRTEGSNLVQKQSSKIESKKGQQQKGIMGSITSFFKGMFGKNDESQRWPTISLAKKQKQKEEVTQQPKINEEKIESVSTETIKRLIEEQDSNGYWKNILLIDELFGPEAGKIAKQQENPLAAAAFLIAFWIERHHPQKKYSLIVKKAYAYASKHTAHFQQFPVVFHRYIQ